MTKKFLLIFLSAALLFPTSLSAQQNTIRLTRYEGERITGISVGSYFDVELIYTPDRSQHRAVVEITPQLEDHLRFSLSPDGVLHVSLQQPDQDDWNFWQWLRQLKAERDINSHKSTAKLTVNLSELTRLKVSGSADVRSSDAQAFSGERLEINCGGAGSAKLASQCKHLSLSVNGAGEVALSADRLTSARATVSGAGTATLRGAADRADFTASGSGDIRAREFRLRQATVKASGAGDIRCYVTESITGSVSGAGDIGYEGNPKQIRISKSGAGSVRAF